MGLRLSKSIGLLLLAAVILPVVVALATSDNTRDIEPFINSCEELAQAQARLVQDELASTTRMLELGAELFDFSTLSKNEITGVLRLLYKQDTNLTVIVLLDETDTAVVPPVYLEPEQIQKSHKTSRHLPMTKSTLARFLERVPIDTARAKGMAFSDVYAYEKQNAVLMAGAMSIPGPKGKLPYILAFEWNLSGLQRIVAMSGRTPSDSISFIVDGGGRLIAHPDGNLVIKRQSMTNDPLVKRFLSGVTHGNQVFSSDGVNVAGAFQSLNFSDWALVLEKRIPAPSHGSFSAWAWIAWSLILLAALGGWTLVHRSIKKMLAGIEQLRIEYDRRAKELNRMQASLLESRKLNAIGDLGAGVAHEFNNPLGGILGLTQLLLRKKKEGDPDRQFLSRIEEEAKRCKAITDNLLRFSEQQSSSHKEPLRVERILEKALDLIDSRLDRERVTIEKHYADELPRIIGNEGDLQRAFLNVLLNAETAMPQGGTLTLGTFEDSGWVEVRITDTGRGIPKENIDRVFEPFFTTKDNWKGAGLGLWVVYQIVDEHGGEIQINSEQDKGVTVIFRFPEASKDGVGFETIIQTD